MCAGHSRLDAWSPHWPRHQAVSFPKTHLGEVVDQTVVKVLPAQVGVTSGGLDLKDALLNGQQADIEGAATQVKDQHLQGADWSNIAGVLLVSCSAADGGQ